MSRLLLDTNILIYLLQGNGSVRELVTGNDWHISFITEMELQMKPGLTTAELKSIRAILGECRVMEMNNLIKEQAIGLARTFRLKLADSIILATARYHDMPLLTADIEFAKVGGKGADVVIVSP